MLNLVGSYHLRKVVSGQCMFLSRSSVDYDATARIMVEKGCFFFNEKWVPNDPFPSLLALKKQANLIVKNTCKVYSGARLYINEGATVILGGGGYINHNFNMSCFKKIEIGEGVIISENVTIRDSDNHSIVPLRKDPTLPIKIGNHVWIGMNVTILKGVTIGDGVVIAAGSLVNKSVPPRCMVAGNPAKVVKENVQWY